MKHFLIIGGGLAGSTLADTMLKNDCKVDLVDAGYNHSSKVAAGQVNPMVFRRMNKSWRIDEFIKIVPDHYRDIEKRSNQQFFHPQVIRRMFAHEQEKDLWKARQDNPDYRDYLTPIDQSDIDFDEAINTYGSGRVKNGFSIHAPTYLAAIHGLIDQHEHGQIIHEKLDFTSIDLSKRAWKGQAYDGIVYCLGFENNDATIWADYPINTTKGQVLTLDVEQMSTTESLNRKCFLIPQPNGQFRAGSTYEWHQTDTTPTTEGRERIEVNLQSLTNKPYEVVDHVAGIRPTTRDRRPICGEHPTQKGHFLFNGLGSKGYMIAPLLSIEMVDFILHQKPLNEAVALQRFLAK